ncbi:hypothetical protein AMAG_00751 [Allomyces macrogynus ATCC 38327]|uniref:Serine/threonine-protein kinase ATR n=1 Tax=Allomyces macrogynus (strain ATCC 38327) TaxID=578462 RepID=A0A0L0RWR9_ALLM3|nr:hypothetical protein AMAG_00751 [Allomyces macrogynus ATCC 38327]|eukprot:KNE54798.1 hypothetical protein AMAG_00751 [Allomyces macrogynus ATCC 38327]
MASEPPAIRDVDLSALRDQLCAGLGSIASTTANGSGASAGPHAAKTVEVVHKLLVGCPELVTESPEACFQVMQAVIKCLSLPQFYALHAALGEVVVTAVSKFYLEARDVSPDLVLEELVDLWEECVQLATLPESSFPALVPLFQVYEGVNVNMDAGDAANAAHAAAQLSLANRTEAQCIARNLERCMQSLDKGFGLHFSWLSHLLETTAARHQLHDRIPDPHQELIDFERRILNSEPYDEELLVAVVERHADAAPILAYDLLVSGLLESSCALTTVEPDPRATTYSGERCVFQVTSAVAAVAIPRLFETRLVMLLRGLVEARQLRNSGPVLRFVLKHATVSEAVQFLAVSAPHFTADLVPLVAAVCLQGLIDLGVNVGPCDEFAASIAHETNVPRLTGVVPAHVAQLRACLLELPRSALPLLAQEWITAECGAPLVDLARDFEGRCGDLASNPAPILAYHLNAPHAHPSIALHPHWKSIAVQLAAMDPAAQNQNLNYFAEALAVSVVKLVHDLCKYLIPVAVGSPALQGTLANVLDKPSFETVLADAFEYLMLDILVSSPRQDWLARIQTVQAQFPRFRGKSVRDLLAICGNHLFIQLCVHQHHEGIAWVLQNGKQKKHHVQDYALGSLMTLSDAILDGDTRWAPQHPSPLDALAAVHWLIQRLGTQHLAMVASQLVGLLSSVIDVFPGPVLACLADFTALADQPVLEHMWCSIVLALLRSNPASKTDGFGPVCDRLISRASAAVLQAAPNLDLTTASDPTWVGVFQLRISEAKKALTPTQRLVNLMASIRSANALVAQASLLDLRRWLVHLDHYHGDPAESLIHDAELMLRLFDVLSFAAEHHATLVGLVSDCLGSLGAIDAVALQLASSNDDNVSFSPTFLCAQLLTECLIPFYRSSMSTVTQTLIAVSIQEILKLCKGKLKGKVNEFDFSTIQHLQHTKYKFVHASAMPEWIMTKRIYLPKLSSQEWACAMVTALAPYVTDPELVKVLAATQQVIVQTKQHRIASLILPHVVRDLCQFKNDTAIDFTVDEFLFVLHHVKRHRSAHDCCMLIVSVLHFLNAWRRQEKYDGRAKADGRKRGAGVPPPSASDQLLHRIPARLVAEAANEIGLYETAAIYLELEANPSNKHITQVYMNQEILDYVLGASRILLDRTVEVEARLHASVGDWAAVQSVYEAALQTSRHQLDLHHGLYSAMRELGYFEGLLQQVNGTLLEMPQWLADLNQYRIEACWKMGEWPLLNQYTADPAPTQPGMASAAAADATASTVAAAAAKNAVSIGHLFNDLAQDQLDTFAQHAHHLQVQTIQRFRLSRSQPALVHNHILSDVISSATLLYHSNDLVLTQFPHLVPTHLGGGPGHPAVQRTMGEWFEVWKQRLARTPEKYEVREDIISACRSILMLEHHRTRPATAAAPARLAMSQQVMAADLGPEWRNMMGELWLMSARLAMKNARQHSAYMNLKHAEELLGAGQLELERLTAKWIGANRSPQAALERIRSLNLPDFDMTSVSVQLEFDAFVDRGSMQFQHARIQLLQARWMDETGGNISQGTAKKFMSVCALQPNWDKAFYLTGRYYHKLFVSMRAHPNDASISEHKDTYAVLKSAIQFLNRSLLVGCRYVYQALPLVLTLWMDIVPQAGASEDHIKYFGEIHALVRSLVQSLPGYMLMNALAQVTSRLCHRSDSVYKVLSQFLVRALLAAPSQAMWQLASSSKSAEKLRVKRCNEVIDAAKKKRPEIAVTTDQMSSLCDRLIMVSNHYTSASSGKRASDTFLLSRDCKALMQKAAFVNIVIPNEAQMIGQLPSDGLHKTAFAPFDPTTAVRIHAFEDTVELMQSLVRPKKVTLIGSDGRRYVFLCKPKDDLRKDARLLEFTGLLNRLLGRSRMTGDRQLHIRTYAVTPLNEQCGLIEWVPHTAALRSLLRIMYRSRDGSELFTKEIQTMFTDTKKLHVNFLKLLDMYKPVLHEWFAENYPNPRTWFAARLKFTRSVAVMSIVGFVLGLGDRHLENILLDVRSGGIMHVDFNCLFEKGKTFTKPEIVPFRLTQNMVAAFGKAGMEGPFRQACVCTLEFLREHREPLMIVLDTFLHDPLIEWKSKKKMSAEGMENYLKAQASTILRGIEDRINGIIGTGLPLGVAGQVEELIQQATATTNLCQMYEGWMAWI